ncbi:hypothetical protein [Streptomyces sp. SID11385]|uniref:hypothetical protein n=1 Tax=Streptomyces sp. SID11385 TaxID=2706031 RepID=UPI0013C9D5DF|nr:hypothetical protein [Streptomyces sp. SID11385]
MEQKQSEANLPPIGAAADPALIPGLTVPSPRTGTDAPGTEPEAAAGTGPDADADAPAAEPADAAPASDAEPEPGKAEAEAETGTEADAEAEPGGATPAEAATDDEAPAPASADDPAPATADGPAAEDTSGEEDEDFRAEAVFTAADRRGSVTLDRDGVRYALDDQACEWTWSEVAAVEYGTSRIGRRLTVTVHTPDERWYPHDVQAPDKATLSRWTEELDAALDAHFEE